MDWWLRGKEWKVGEMGKGGQREQTSPYKININKSQWGNVQNGEVCLPSPPWDFLSPVNLCL